MILSRRIALGGVPLDSVDGSILIQSIVPGTPLENVSAVNLMGGWGQKVTTEHYETLECSVSYTINVDKRDLTRRRQVFDRVNAWALKKGWLTLNFMPGKRMYVDKVIVPDMGDPRARDSEFTITFRAYNVPFWQDETPSRVSASVTGSSTSQTIRNRGNVRGVMDVTFTNTSGSTMTTFSVTIGGKTLALTGLTLGDGKLLQIHHGTDGLLRITEDGTSAYGKQSAGGLTELVLEPGDNTVTVAYGQTGDLELRCFGRYV